MSGVMHRKAGGPLSFYIITSTASSTRGRGSGRGGAAGLELARPATIYYSNYPDGRLAKVALCWLGDVLMQREPCMIPIHGSACPTILKGGVFAISKKQRRSIIHKMLIGPSGSCR